MINGIGIVGWGVGGIEAEAGMLGQPVYFLTPDVVGVHLTGALKEGVTATDPALTVTQLLRKAKVVGKFVEFYGPGAAALPVVDRATIATWPPNTAPRWDFSPWTRSVRTISWRPAEAPSTLRSTRPTTGPRRCWGIPKKGDIDYSQDIELDLGTVVPSVAGPKRPQDRIELPNLKREFIGSFSRPVAESGFGKKAEDFKGASVDVQLNGNGTARLGHGSVLIAAITSCTNTSNPSVMLAAGLLAKKAVERGLRVDPPSSPPWPRARGLLRDYLTRTSLQPYLDTLGFQLVGYGCTTCIGNSGPLLRADRECRHQGGPRRRVRALRQPQL